MYTIANCPRTITCFIAILLLPSFAICAEKSLVNNIDNGLVGHWKFDGDCNDYSGQNNNGRIVGGVNLKAQGRNGKPNTAAKFDGIDDYIEVPDNNSLHFGMNSFTIAAWVYTEQDMNDVIGDVVTKYDDYSRTGFNLYIKGCSPLGMSQHDTRNVHFGIDNSIDGEWEDCGKPWPTNYYVTPMAIYKGGLYAGISDSAGDVNQAGHVFRYVGGKDWADCGRVCENLVYRGITGLFVHNGNLYAAAGDMKSNVTRPSDAQTNFAHVYRYDGDKKWVDCGQVGENWRVRGFASFKGDLYAYTDCKLPDPNRGNSLYRYTGGITWIDCGRPPVKPSCFINCLAVHNGCLYAGVSHGDDGGKIFRYDGKGWTYVSGPKGENQMHTLEVYKGQLYAGSWPQGMVSRYDGGTTWTDCGQLGVGPGVYYFGKLNRIDEVQTLVVYNGKFYAGVIPRAELYRYNGQRDWILIHRFGADYVNLNKAIWDTWKRLPVAAVYKGKLFVAQNNLEGQLETNPQYNDGRVFCMSVGANVSYDDDMAAGWKHIAAVRNENKLRLYINGKLVGESEPFKAEYDISNKQPLKIGFGAVDYFTGKIDEMRIYNRALTEAEVTNLFEQ